MPKPIDAFVKVNPNLPANIWFRFLVERAQTHFKDPVDTLMLKNGIKIAAKLAKSLGIETRLLDLGTGVGIPPTLALKTGLVESASGIEIDPGAVQNAITFADKNSRRNKRAEIIMGDIFQPDILTKAKNLNPTMLSGNLPYLPSRENFDSTVNGGKDGTNLIKKLFDYAKALNPGIITMNMCSMTTPDKILQLLDETGYVISHVLAIEQGFGEYSTQMAKEGIITTNAGQYYYEDPNTKKKKQVIMNLVLVRKDLAQQNNIGVIKNEQVNNLMEDFQKTGKLPNIIGRLNMKRRLLTNLKTRSNIAIN